MTKLLTTLNFGEWLPDLPEYQNPGSPQVSNVLWVNGAYAPAPGFSSLGAALPARCQGAYAALDDAGGLHVYAGTGTQLLEYTGTGFTDRSGGSYTTADGQSWKFVESSSPGFGNLIIATNFADPVQAMTVGDTAFAALAGTPPAAAKAAPAGQGTMDPNLLDQQKTIYGETAGIYPQLQAQADGKGVYHPANWDADSADQLKTARAWMAGVRSVNHNVQESVPDLSNGVERMVWNNAVDAAQAAQNLRLPPGVNHFYIRQDGSWVRNRELHPDLYGQIDLGRKVLDIADDLEGEEAVYALLHEVLHGEWAHRGMPERLQEERAVTELAWGLTGLFRDNPGLLTHLDGLLNSAQ